MMGKVYWVTGLSGAGKTTIGNKLYEHLRLKNKNIIFLDGDILRDVFQVYDYTTAGRKALAFQYSRLCRMLSEQGLDVVICTISMYREVRDWNRKNISGYIEIFLNVSIEELIRRDQKGLYTKNIKCDNGEVVGLNLDAELPTNPDICIDNYGYNTPEKAVETILDYCKMLNKEEK